MQLDLVDEDIAFAFLSKICREADARGRNGPSWRMRLSEADVDRQYVKGRERGHAGKDESLRWKNGLGGSGTLHQHPTRDTEGET